MSIPTARQWLTIPLTLALSGAAFYLMRLGPDAQASGKHFEMVSEGGEYAWPESNLILRRHYTGFGPLDFGLSFLVAAFMPGVYGAGMNAAFEEQQPYFLMSFAPIVAAMSVEAGRERNAGALLTLYDTISRPNKSDVLIRQCVVPRYGPSSTKPSAELSYFRFGFSRISSHPLNQITGRSRRP